LLGEKNQSSSPDVAAPCAATPAPATRTERSEWTAESEGTATEGAATERRAAGSAPAVAMVLGVVVRESTERKIGAPGVTEPAAPTPSG
jgi:hypothetical protein